MSPQKIAALGQTADILAQACGVPVAITDALREWDVGIFERTADQRGWDMHRQVQEDWFVHLTCEWTYAVSGERMQGDSCHGCSAI